LTANSRTILGAQGRLATLNSLHASVRHCAAPSELSFIFLSFFIG